VTSSISPQRVITVPIEGTASTFPLRRIFCVGRNYEAHAHEMGVSPDRESPFYFTKSAFHYAPSDSTVAYPTATKNYQFEMELVVAIGSPGYQLSQQQALDCTFGYACGLDMTRRDLQLEAREKKRPWDLGKDFEDSAIIAPIVPASRCGHLTRGRIELRVNGELKQSSNLNLLIHSVAAVIVDLSLYYHLQPGDVIFTGTPAGVGPVLPGDRLEGAIEGIGSIALTIR
jgi:fumarylpyruvate hydrolase